MPHLYELGKKFQEKFPKQSFSEAVQFFLSSIVFTDVDSNSDTIPGFPFSGNLTDQQMDDAWKSLEERANRL